MTKGKGRNCLTPPAFFFNVCVLLFTVFALLIFGNILLTIEIDVTIIIVDRVQSSVKKEILKDFRRLNKKNSTVNCKGCSISSQEYA